MKTIVARFTEMKKSPNEIIDVDGEEVSANKVEAALKSVGVALRDTNGEFRNLDDVFLELSSKWDSLDKMSQRYVATTAAGSRQQSRFIAMMSNYQRTMELTGYATNSAGASQRQFEKTLDSLESKLNRLHDAWEQFTTGIANQSIIKGVVDLLTNLLTVVNNVTDALDPLHTGWSKILVAFLGFKAAKGVVNGVLRNIGGQLATGMGKEAIKGANNYSQNFSKTLKKLFSKKTWVEGGSSKEDLEKLRINQKLTEELRKQAQKKKEEAVAAENAARAAREEAIAAKQSYKNTISQQAPVEEQRGARNLYNLKESKAKELETKARLQNTAAVRAEQQALVQEKAAQQLENTTTEMGILTKTKYRLQLLFGNKATRESASAALQDASAKGVQTGATSAATGAQWSLNAAMEACPIGWIIAGIAALVAATIVLVNVFNSFKTDKLEEAKKKLENTSEALSGLQSSLTKTNESLNDLNDSWEKLSNFKEELAKLDRGTLDWKKKLVEVNSEVLNLVNKYPQLSKFLESKDGILNIKEEGYQNLVEAQTQSAQLQSAAVSVLSALQAEQKSEVLRNTYNTDYNEKQNSLLMNTVTRNSNLQTGIGQSVELYAQTSGKHLSDIEKNLIQGALTSKETLKEFEKLKDKTKANTKTYATLLNISEEEVKKQKENGELTDETIKATIAYNEFQYQISDYAAKIAAAYESGKLENNLFRRAISGVNTLKTSDIKGKESGIEELSKLIDENGDILDGQTERVKKILVEELGFSEELLTSYIEEMGGSLSNIGSNVINSFRSEKGFEEIKESLNTNNREYLDSFLKIAEDSLGEELDSSQKETVAQTFKNIAKQGGDVSGFKDTIVEILNGIQDVDGRKEFIKALNTVDFTSETNINNFINNLDNLDTSLKNNVTKSLVQATNAANDFNLSHFTEELKDFDLSKTITEKLKDSNFDFTTEEYEQIKTNLTKHNREDLLNLFSDIGGEYMFTGTKEQLEDIQKRYVLGLESSNEEIDNLLDKQEKGKDKLRILRNVRFKAQDFDVVEGIWDIEGLENLIPKEAQEKIKTASSSKERLDLYNDALMYMTDLKGNTYISESEGNLTDENGHIINIYAIEKLLNKLEEMSDKERQYAVSLLPEKFKNFVMENYNEYASRSEIDWSHGADNGKISNILEEKANEIDLALVANLLGGRNSTKEFNAREVFSQNSWTSSASQRAANQQKIDELKEAGIELTDNEIEQHLDDTQHEFRTFLDNLENKYKLTEEEQKKLEEISAKKYQGMFDAEAILSEKPTNKIEEKAQLAQIDALLRKHQDWQTKLKEIQEEYNVTEDNAKKLLAIQYKQIESVDQIKSILSDNKDILSEENIEQLKGTEQYNVAISSLVENFKSIFGDKIDTSWVEKHINDIRELAKGGDVAEEAMQRLAATEEAVPKTLEIKIVAEEDIKLYEEYHNSLKMIFDELNDASNISKEKVTNNIKKIQEQLDKLNNSNVSVYVKTETYQALADLIKVGLVKAMISKNSTEFAELLQLASDSGISVRGINKYISASANEGKITYDFNSTNEEVLMASIKTDTPIIEGISDLATKIITQTSATLGEIGKGSGGIETDKDEEETKKEESTWENDWNRQTDILKRIEGLERESNKLEKERQRLLKNRFMTEQQITQAKEKQRKNLEEQLKLNRQLAADARGTLNGLNSNGNFDGTVWWDNENKIIRTNDSVIASMDEETKKLFDKEFKWYESYAEQLNTASDNIDKVNDTIESLTSEIKDFDFHKNIENLINVIDTTISLYDKAQERLKWTERGVSTKQISELAQAKDTELVRKEQAYTDDFIQAEARINALLNQRNTKGYYNFNWKTGQIARTQAYYSSDQELRESILDPFLDQLEELVRVRTEAEVGRIDAQDQRRNAREEYRKSSMEFEQNVYDAIIKAREKEITQLENINTSIQNAASELVSSIQKNIQKIRQERTNQKTEEELSKMQARLDFLGMDTSSGNQKTILDLEKQLQDKQQSYTDSLIDQKISELQDQNTEAEKQRKQQIEVLKTQLEVQKSSGKIWEDVRYLIAAGLDATGNIKADSELGRILKEWGSYSSLSAEQKKDWLHTQNLGSSTYNYYNNKGGSSLGTSQINYSAAGGTQSYAQLEQQQVETLRNQLDNMINKNSSYNKYMKYNKQTDELEQIKAFPIDEYDVLNKVWLEAQGFIGQIKSLIAYYNHNQNAYFSQIPQLARYASGGLADFTGPAWLDGTPSSPELVLSARDTENFIRLKDILSDYMKYKGTNRNAQVTGDSYFEIHIDVDKITNDYDVDLLVERMKQQISDISRYRNVNTINSIR